MTNPGPELIALARSAIGAVLGMDAVAAGASRSGGSAPTLAAPPDSEFWSKPGATFVTITMDGELRGCIGSLLARRPLAEDLIGNARAAAFNDPRFPPLTAQEFPHICIEVSVLSEPVPVRLSTRDEALAALGAGRDGWILIWHEHQSTFLPQVWEQLPDPAAFLDHLLVKAGLPPGFWDPDVRLARYTVTPYRETPSQEVA